MRVDPAEFLRLDLRAHEILRGVPLRDVSAVELPGGGEGRTVADARALLMPGGGTPQHPAVSALMGLRFAIGRAFGWDRETIAPDESYLSRLSERDRRDSDPAPGTFEGPFMLLYQHPRESLSEIRNATVHAFLSVALAPAAGGYRLYWAVYVRPVSWATPLYMAAIEPFRRFIVYPAMLGRLREAWSARYG